MKQAAFLKAAASQRRWPAYIETLTLVVLLLVANVRWLPGSPGYAGWTFNPYLLVVLVTGGRYGIGVGLFGALCSGLAFVASLAGQVTGMEELSFLTPAHIAVPVMLGLTGLIAGGLTDRWKGLLSQALTEHQKLVQRFEKVSSQYTKLLDEKHMLDKQVLSEEQTFEALVALFEDLDQQRPGKIPGRIVPLAAQVLGGGTAAIYRIGKRLPEAVENPRRKASRVAATGSWPETLELKEPVIALALRRSEPVTITHVAGWMNLEDPGPEAIQLACRMVPAKSGACLLLVMRDLPFAAFSPSRQRALSVAMKVAAKALLRARLFQRMQDRNVVDPVTKASSYAYFNKRLEEEYFRARRHQIPLSVLAVSTARLEKDLPHKSLMEVRRGLARAFQETLRLGDLLAHAQRRGSFLILCPHSAPDDAQVVGNRLLGKIRELGGSKTPVPMAVVTVNPERSSLDEVRHLLNRAEGTHHD